MEPRQGKRESKRVSKTKGFTLNAAIPVVVSARYSKGMIKGEAKKSRGRASPLTKSPFRPNVHSNILMCCRRHCWHVHLFESCNSGCLFFWLNCLLLVIRWAIKGPWASSIYSNNDPTSPKGPRNRTTEPILGTALLGKNQLQPLELESAACFTIPFGFSLFWHILVITFQLLYTFSAKDHWRGFSTQNAHMAHIVNLFRLKMVFTS